MGLFSFTRDVAIDLGTANTIVSYNGKIVVDEPSVVAIDGQKKMIAVGEKAKQMHEKTNPNIQTIRPLRDGVIEELQERHREYARRIGQEDRGDHQPLDKI